MPVTAWFGGNGLGSIATNSRGVWATATTYFINDIVIAPTGDIVTPVVPFTTGVSYSASDWRILVPAAGFPGRELAFNSVATSLTSTNALTTTGVAPSLTDTTKDINTAVLDVSPVIGSRPILIEVCIEAFFGVTGGYGARLYDKTSGTVVAQDLRATATAFQIQSPLTMKAPISPAAGTRQYGVKVNGTAGTNSFNIEGTDNNCQSWIRVTER